MAGRRVGAVWRPKLPKAARGSADKADAILSRVFPDAYGGPKPREMARPEGRPTAMPADRGYPITGDRLTADVESFGRKTFRPVDPHERD